jgi:hypothetical protein
MKAIDRRLDFIGIGLLGVPNSVARKQANRAESYCQSECGPPIHGVSLSFFFERLQPGFFGRLPN